MKTNYFVCGAIQNNKIYWQNRDDGEFCCFDLKNNIFKYLYGFIIIISIFTSAISAGYSFLKNVSSNKKTYKLVLIFMCVSSVLISPIGFSKLVEVLYPFFGLLGLIPIIYLLNFKSNNINNVKLLEKNLKN